MHDAARAKPRSSLPCGLAERLCSALQARAPFLLLSQPWLLTCPDEQLEEDIQTPGKCVLPPPVQQALAAGICPASEWLENDFTLIFRSPHTWPVYVGGGFPCLPLPSTSLSLGTSQLES